jgi:hypothetical protein
MKKTLFYLLLLLAAMKIDAQTVTYTYDNAGNRIARVITLLKSSSAPAQAKAIEALPDLIAEKAIKIYPNPTDGIVSVEIEGYSDEINAEFLITDLSGRVIANRKATTSYQSFDLSRQTAGIYLMKITVNVEAVIWKIVKK